jgi:hypothetical protein
MSIKKSVFKWSLEDESGSLISSSTPRIDVFGVAVIPEKVSKNQ